MALWAAAFIGSVTNETYSTFSSGSVPSVRGEVDGNFVVKGEHTVGSGDSAVQVDNAVYSAAYKNLSGQSILVPSTTAFDPTKDDRTGTMAAIDSPTAGPNKGTTTTFTLGADHFEFRSPCRAGTCPRTAQSAALAHSARESQTELMKKRMQTLFPVLTPS